MVDNQDSKTNHVLLTPQVEQPAELENEKASTEAKYPVIGEGRRSSLGKSLVQPEANLKNLVRADQGRQGQS